MRPYITLPPPPLPETEELDTTLLPEPDYQDILSEQEVLSEPEPVSSPEVISSPEVLSEPEGLFECGDLQDPPPPVETPPYSPLFNPDSPLLNPDSPLVINTDVPLFSSEPMTPTNNPPPKPRKPESDYR